MHQLGSLEHVDELLALASGSDLLAYSYQACIVNGVRFVSYNRDQNRITQNSGVCVAGTEGFNYYGQLEEILQLSFTGSYSVVLFRCKWFNTDPKKKKTITVNNITSINVSGEWYKDEPFILASQAKQVFYIDDLVRGRDWKVVQEVNHRQVWDFPDASDMIADVDVVHDTNSSNFVLTVDLGELVVQQSDVPATQVNTAHRPSLVVQEDDGFINDNEDDMADSVEEAEDEDELIVDLSDDNTDDVCPIDVDVISEDSDYST